jgi:hypothetical protein
MNESALIAPLREVSLPGRMPTDGREEEILVEGYKPVLPDGSYEARFIGHETAIVFGGPKVFLHFQIVQPGPHMDTCLFRAYRVRRLVGKPGRGGRFVAHPQGDLFRVIAKLLDVKLRKDRISLAALRTMLFRVTTRTVTRNHRQQPMPEPVCYSVIDAIERGG